MQLLVWGPWTTFSRSVADSYALHKPGSREKFCNYRVRVERLFIDRPGHRLCSWMSVAFVRRLSVCIITGLLRSPESALSVFAVVTRW